jgi:omega-amidase
MNVLALQFDVAWHDPRANHAKVSAMLDAAGAPAGALVVLPEMFATGFTTSMELLAGLADGESEMFLLESARQRNVCIIGGLVARDDEGSFCNEAFVAFPDGRLPLRYRKIHPFTPGGEDRCIRARDDVIVFEWQGLQIAPFICYDLRFPEVFRAATRSGAQVLAVIANWPASREEHWLTLLKARAIENQCYVIGVNRCGADPTTRYMGRSEILGPRGGEIAAASGAQCAISAKLDAAALLDCRAQFPVLQDMRPAFQTPLNSTMQGTVRQPRGAP